MCFCYQGAEIYTGKLNIIGVLIIFELCQDPPRTSVEL